MTPRPFATLRAVVAEVYGITEANIGGRRRWRKYVYPRQMLACAARELLRWSFPRIGKEMGQDHTAVIYSHKKVLMRLESDEVSQRKLRQITSEYARRMIMEKAA